MYKKLDQLIKKILITTILFNLASKLYHSKKFLVHEQNNYLTATNFLAKL